MKYKKILFIEDNKSKFVNNYEFIESSNSEISITRKESFSSGLKEITKNRYDLLLLDMSIPVRDDMQSSNNYMQLGGHKILSELARKKISLKTVVVTMYSEFSTGISLINLDEINVLFKKKFENIYVDYVYYSSHRDDWKDKIVLLLNHIL